MKNELLNVINIGNIIEKTAYKEIGANTELGLYYKSNDKDYIVESLEGYKFTLMGDTVKTVCSYTGYDEEEILDLLYLIYAAYKSYQDSIETDNIAKSNRYGKKMFKMTKEDGKYFLKIQERIIAVLTELLTKYDYSTVFSYMSEMSPFSLIKFFNGLPAGEEMRNLQDDLTMDYSRVLEAEQEELVSRHFR